MGESEVTIWHQVMEGASVRCGKAILLHTMFTVHQNHETILYLPFFVIISLLLKWYALGRDDAVFLVMFILY